MSKHHGKGRPGNPTWEAYHPVALCNGADSLNGLGLLFLSIPRHRILRRDLREFAVEPGRLGEVFPRGLLPFRP